MQGVDVGSSVGRYLARRRGGVTSIAVAAAVAVGACSLGDPTLALPDPDGGTDASSADGGRAGGGASSGGRSAGGEASGGRGAGGEASGGRGAGGAAAGGAMSGGGDAGLDSGPGDGGSGPDASDAAPVDDDVLIQSIQDGTVGLATPVTARGVFVTGSRRQTQGGFAFSLQEPQGKTSGAHAYPEYAALRGFMASPDASDVLPSVGDCLDVSGTTGAFRGLTEILVDSFQVASDCGTFPVALAVPGGDVTFENLATDTDPASAGYQAGVKSRTYQEVLIRLIDVEVVVGPDAQGTFALARQGDRTGPVMEVGGFYFLAAPAVGQQYSSVRGVLSQFDRFQIYPRTNADLQ